VRDSMAGSASAAPTMKCAMADAIQARTVWPLRNA
jgi:hypothetical protein